jgi:hypothetical protein
MAGVGGGLKATWLTATKEILTAVKMANSFFI